MTDLSMTATPITRSQDSMTAQQALKTVALIGLTAIALGFVMQGVILSLKLSGGAAFPGAAILVDLAQGVTWSFLVCAGVGIGTSVMKARPLIAGVLGFVCAPIGMAAAKAVQKAMASAIGADASPAILSLALISAFRALEYGVLAYWLATLVRRDVHGVGSYLGTGLAIGLGFGAVVSAVTVFVAGDAGIVMDMTKLSVTVFNEIAFPIGCAAVIFVSQLVPRNMKAIAG